LIPPFNSTLPNNASDNNSCHSKRAKHTRFSLLAAAACAAGALTATTVAASVTPWADASAHVASSVSAGQAGTDTVQLDARIRPTPGASAPSNAAPSNAAAPAQVVSPASDWARSLAFTPAKQASAVQAPAAHEAALQGPPAAPAVSPIAADKVKSAQTPVARPKAIVAHPVLTKAAPVRKAPAKVAPVHVAPAKPYQIYDSVTPTSIPAGHQVAVYANGMYQASWSSVAGRSKVLWIDTKGNNPGANVLDVEPGDATPSGAVPWVKARLNAHQNQVAIVYTYLSAWQAVRANMATLPSWMQAKVRYWIADPTGVNHVVPGSSATQWYWGKYYDITTASPGFETP
jgi:hypothetical protein